MPIRVAVLASGGGSNLQALLDAQDAGAPFSVVLVASDRAKAGALDRARSRNIATRHLSDPTDGGIIAAALREADAELVVLAGYLKLVPASVVTAFAGRLINIHPALLPAFGGPGMYGRRVHEAVIASGATVSGCTVHLVNAEYDQGVIVAQWPVAVAPDDTPDTLQKRVLSVEHQLLPAVVSFAARTGRLVRLLPAPGAFGTADGDLASQLIPSKE